MAYDDRDCMQCRSTRLVLLDRIDVKLLLLGSQHHPRTCTTSTNHLLHSLLLLTPLISANYHIALTQALLHFINITTLTCQIIPASQHALKIHQSVQNKHVMQKEFYFYFNLI
jgi:hypothetical protein